MKQGTTIFVKNPENLSIKQSSMISFFFAKQPIKTSKKNNNQFIYCCYKYFHYPSPFPFYLFINFPIFLLFYHTFPDTQYFLKFRKQYRKKSPNCMIVRRNSNYICITIIKIVMIKRLNGSIKELSTAATERLYPQRSVYTGATLKIGPKTTSAKT